jgi:hypothetical protein
MSRFIRLVSTLGLTGMLFSYLPAKAMAAGDVADIKGWMGRISIYNETASGNPEAKIANIINYVVGALGLVAVLFLIIGGVQYMTAGGDDGKVESATKTIKNALIGLAVIVLSGLIVNFVFSILAK